MDERVQKKEVSQFLRRLKRKYEDDTGTDISDAGLCAKIVIAPSVWNGYKKGHNLPGPDNARLIGEWIGRFLGAGERDRFLTIAGHDPKLRVIEDERLVSIIDAWEDPAFPENLPTVLRRTLRFQSCL